MTAEGTSAKILSTVWMRAAMLGSVWASVEIILGSFLHNLRVPFTGTTLTAVGVSLLVAGQSLWPDRGLVWRAGVICALMKAISPSAVLIGPMIGILSESLMMELAVRFLGRNIVGFLLGGALAVCMPLTYRIVELIVAFGFNIAPIYTGLYRFAASRLGITGFEAGDLLMVLYGIYAVFGLVAAALGLIVAKRARALRGQVRLNHDVTEEYRFQQADSSQRYSLPFLVIHLLLVPAGMIAIGRLPVYGVAAFLAIYAVWVAYRYPRAWRRLRKPTVWIVILAVSLAGGVILGKLGSESVMDGIIIGLQMVLRAVLMIAAFGSISVELRNPAIVQWFLKRGMGQVSAALEVAFGALPKMISLLKRKQGVPRRPFDILARLLAEAELWLQTFSATGALVPTEETERNDE